MIIFADARADDASEGARPALMRLEPEGRAKAKALALAPAARFAPPPLAARRDPRPKIALIVDDLGLDRAALNEVLTMPGPLTLSLLPYGRNLKATAARAKAAGHAVMLHLPMEPVGGEDPGPHALTVEMDPARLRQEIAWNLSRFDGYTGVNNHMGSKLTSDAAVIAEVMSALRPHTKYFLDSITIASSVAKSAAERAGLPAYARDVFLDDAPGREAVLARIAELEAHARANGLAIGIVHPRATSLDAVSDWLRTVTARGFDLITMDEVHAQSSGRRPLVAETVADAGQGS
ncbi:MAG: divergent polysaccharide deacetylase family protein [Pseudomonadota bacterium]